jgi:subtilisin family serine protease
LNAPPAEIDWRLLAAAKDPQVAQLLGFDPQRLPVWVELRRASLADWRALRKAGLQGGIAKQPLIGAFSSGWVAPGDLARLAAHPALLRLETYTPAQIHAPLYATNEHLRSRRSANLHAPNHALFGQGMRVVDVDVGLDYNHPAFFEPGEPIAFVDVDGNRALSAGDGVDLDGDGEIGENEQLVVLQSRIHDWSAGLIEGSELDLLEPDLDWLFIDRNSNGRRDVGLEAMEEGEATPGFGEPVFAMLDRDANGRFDSNDRLIPMLRSRVEVYRHGQRSYRRGTDLSLAPHEDDLHGTGVWGILAAGPPGHRFAGIAPKTTILHFHRNRFNLVDAVHFAFAEKADLVLHEYGAWVHQFSDGSSIVERLAGHSQALGVPHVLPAGNLASSRRSARLTMPPFSEQALELFLPPRGIEVLYGSVLWRGASNLEVYLTPRGGSEQRLPVDALDARPFDSPRQQVVGEQRQSVRGTHKLDWVLWAWADGLRPLPNRAWQMRLVNPSDAPIEVMLRIADNKSSWTGGAHFRGEGFSTKAGSVTWPSTATANENHGLSVFAFAGRAERAGGRREEATGDLRDYSGHGPLIDGRGLSGLAAPDNPSTTWPSSKNEVGHAGYGSFNGTSGAGPHVAAALALLMQTGLSASAAIQALLGAGMSDAAVEAGPPGAWGAGKVRLDRAFDRSLLPLAQEFEPPVADEPGPFALARPPEEGFLRLRLGGDQPWLDWRQTPLFLDGADRTVEVEWISSEGRRGRYLQAMTVPAQPSQPGALPAPLPEAVVAARPRPQAPRFEPPNTPLVGAPPPPASCQSLPFQLFYLLPLLLGIRRRL